MNAYRQPGYELPIIKPPKNVYRYIEHNSFECPFCRRKITETNWGALLTSDRGKYRACSPQNRVVVKGFWFWRSYCPINGLHCHAKCFECKLEWIQMIKSEIEERVIHD